VISRANISGYTFTSTLQFLILSAGLYTCRIGAGTLASSRVISVDGMHLLTRNSYTYRYIICYYYPLNKGAILDVVSVDQLHEIKCIVHISC
jgi:hypothetical protein